ncbi:helix-turn-helix domain-containing protein [Clostridium intestinale]|uniref:Helix-turn-helix n=1 Tax=Clostridium intestinale DSM 6191 TaxID=1121320 RepID=A0A1M5ZQT5_9CLOT|nr:helix-turn-helix transcriptional regulator [Clostridium intestinale]SHI26552.1 Helix-turn-helix [Clostridium intestinale DSM 6191]
MSLEQAIAVVLKKYRLENNFTQEEFAFRCSLDTTYISLLERALRKPTLSVVFTMCTVLNIKASVFVKEVEELLEKKI